MRVVELLCISVRLLLETLSFFNSRYLYQNFDVSASLVIYTTHSFCGLLLLIDVFRYKRDILNVIERRTGVRKTNFVLSTILLSLFSNFKSLLKLSVFRSTSDAAIIALSCSSVLFTKLVFAKDERVGKRKKFAILLVVIGMLVVTFGEGKYTGCFYVLLTAFMSSLYSVLYKRMIDKDETLDEKVERLKHRKYEAIESLENSRKLEVYLKSPLSEESSADRTILEARPFDSQEDKACQPKKAPYHRDHMNTGRDRNELLGGIDFDSRSNAGPGTCRKPHVTGSRLKCPYSMDTVSSVLKGVLFKWKNGDEGADRLRRVYATYYYMSLTGAITALFYWPLLFLCKNECWCPKYLFLILISVLLSTLLNFYYFVVIGLVSAVFAQLSCLLFKVVVLAMHVADNGLRLRDFGAFFVLLAVFYIN